MYHFVVLRIIDCTSMLQVRRHWYRLYLWSHKDSYNGPGVKNNVIEDSSAHAFCPQYHKVEGIEDKTTKWKWCRGAMKWKWCTMSWRVACHHLGLQTNVCSCMYPAGA